MIWLVDLGNSRLKLGTKQDLRDDTVTALDLRLEDFPERLSRALEGQPGVRTAWLASVAPDDCVQRVEERLEQSGCHIRRVRASTEALGFQTGYERVAELGVDRWLALLAAHLSGDGPCLVVSAGSLLTCDALAGDGRHLGGWIAPTPTLMRDAVHRRVPALADGQGEVMEFARGTADGIWSGCVLAAVGLVDRGRKRLEEQVGQKVPILLSGGQADLLQPFLDDCRPRPHLVLEGLAAWAEAFG